MTGELQGPLSSLGGIKLIPRYRFFVFLYTKPLDDNVYRDTVIYETGHVFRFRFLTGRLR